MALEKLSRAELRRMQRDQNKTYTFTRAQLDARDQELLKGFKEECKKQCIKEMEDDYAKREKQVKELVDIEWKKRAAEFASGDKESDFLAYMKYFLAMCSKIMIEEFRWKIPTAEKIDRRNRLSRFLCRFDDEINSICNDELKDFRTAAKEVEQKYGLSFEVVEE